MINGISIINIKKEDNFEKDIFNANLSLSEPHAIKNSDILSSKDFSITNNNGLSTISGTIENTSENELTDLNFIYTLYDSSKNAFYEFEISVLDLTKHSSTSFSSICLQNLSNITDYSVSLTL